MEKCWLCGKVDVSIHKAKVIIAGGMMQELNLCDMCHMYWGE